MSRKVVLLRVGIDSGCGGIQGPLFEDGTFEFICIPDGKRVSVHTYGKMVGKNGESFVSYFPEGQREMMASQTVHVDPEWETFTYGDPTSPKRSLQSLNPGDVLAFYCGLQEWDSESGWNTKSRPALYLAGYFEVKLAGMARDFNEKSLKKEFGRNFHVRMLPFTGSKRTTLCSSRAVPKAGCSTKLTRLALTDRIERASRLRCFRPPCRRYSALSQAMFRFSEVRLAGWSRGSWTRRLGF